MSDIHSFIIDYIDENPKCIYLEKGMVAGKPRYRARIIFRGNISILIAICARFAPPKEKESKKINDIDYYAKRCESGILRISDGELYLLLKHYKHLLEPNTRIDFAAEIVNKKHDGYGRGRGNKSKTFQYEEIYQKYLKLNES